MILFWYRRIICRDIWQRRLSSYGFLSSNPHRCMTLLLVHDPILYTWNSSEMANLIFNSKWKKETILNKKIAVASTNWILLCTGQGSIYNSLLATLVEYFTRIHVNHHEFHCLNRTLICIVWLSNWNTMAWIMYYIWCINFCVLCLKKQSSWYIQSVHAKVVKHCTYHTGVCLHLKSFIQHLQHVLQSSKTLVKIPIHQRWHWSVIKKRENNLYCAS